VKVSTDLRKFKQKVRRKQKTAGVSRSRLRALWVDVSFFWCAELDQAFAFEFVFGRHYGFGAAVVRSKAMSRYRRRSKEVSGLVALGAFEVFEVVAEIGLEDGGVVAFPPHTFASVAEAFGAADEELECAVIRAGEAEELSRIVRCAPSLYQPSGECTVVLLAKAV